MNTPVKWSSLIVLLMSALVAAAGPMATSAAQAREGDRSERPERERPNRESPNRESPNREREQDDGGLRDGDRGGQTRGDDRPRGRRADDGRIYIPRQSYRTFPGRGTGYVPDGFRGEPLPDYGRYRLRAPPRGFVWIRMSSGYAMVDTASGRIFDFVPN